jgi:hypothetical protein
MINIIRFENQLINKLSDELIQSEIAVPQNYLEGLLWFDLNFWDTELIHSINIEL